MVAKKLRLLSLIMFSLAACATLPSPSPLAPPSATPVASAPVPASTVVSSPSPLPPTAPLSPAAPAASSTIAPPTAMPTLLPPEPQIIEFQAEDGQTLAGRYYPSALNPAPLVVLMHWARGDQHDWDEIALWLQARQAAGQTPNPQALPWLDPSWFPSLPAGRSFAVFTFTFRHCEGGCKTFTRELWLLDAQAAMLAASRLEGIDPQRIVAIGASIGADGAADGCAWLNAQAAGQCRGALSLSPGSYLTVQYPEVVAGLGALQPPIAVWCLYAQNDDPSAVVCRVKQGEHYRAIEYAGDAHGMSLLQPMLSPNPLQLFLDFLELTLP